MRRLRRSAGLATLVVLSSFVVGGAPDATAQAPRSSLAPPTVSPDPSVVLEFDSADIETVIRVASEIVGFNYVLGPDVRGTVTVRTVGGIPRADVLGVLRGILEVQGFAAVEAQGLYKVVRTQAARGGGVPIIVGATADPTRPRDEVIAHIVPLRVASAAPLVAALRPLISKDGSLLAPGGTNVIVIVDVASNVRRALEVIGRVDTEVERDEFDVIPVRFADAVELAAILNERARRVADPAGGRPPALVIAERRSNALVVHAGRDELEAIRRLIGELDVDVPGGRRTFVYYAAHAKAKDLAETLRALYAERDNSATAGAADPGPGRRPPRVTADERTNGVIVVTAPAEWPEIETTIRRLDRAPRQVLVETLVVEIGLTDETRLGIDWAAKIGPARLVSSTTEAIPAEMTLALVAVPGGGFTALGLAGDAFVGLLHALASENRLAVVSRASVAVAENQKAVVNVSDSIPIVTAQQAAIGGVTTPEAPAPPVIVGTQSVEFRDVGVVLTVEPRVGAGGTVALGVKQEVNDLGAPEPPTGSRRIFKRELETSVVLQDNQTLVLGGLIRDGRSTDHRGVPFLKDIPVVGRAFGTKTRRIDKTELLILVTPRVMESAPAPGRTSER